MKNKVTLVILSFIFSISLTAQCINYTITTTQTGVCSEAAGDQVYSNSNNGNVITLTVNGTFTINGNFTVERENVVINGTLIVNGDYDQERGSVVVNGDLIVNGDYTQTRGTMTMNGNMTTTGQFFSGALSGVTITDGGSMEVGSLGSAFGALFTIENGGYLNVIDDLVTAGFAGFNVEDGGAVDVGGDFTHGGYSNVTIDGVVDVVGDFISIDDNSTLEGDGELNVGGTYDNGGGDDSGFTGTYNGGQPLPVELVYFKGNREDGKVVLEWLTSAEINNEGFEIQRSGNGMDFIKIDFVPGHGNSSEEHKYLYIDGQPTHGNTYYRFRQLDFDGQFEFSPVILVADESMSNKLEIYPNPTAGSIQIIGSFTDLQLYDPSGRLMIELTNTTRLESQKLISDVLESSPAGTYTLNVVSGDHRSSLRIVRK